MKTLCFTLGLMLLVVCCCNAMPQAVQYNRASRCCAKFFSQKIPPRNVVDINKTPITCLKKGFIVKTVRGLQICYHLTSEWAQNLYKQLH